MENIDRQGCYGDEHENTDEVLSTAAARQTTQQSLLITGLIAVIGIFLLLQSSAKSWRMALANLLILPAALAGGVLAAVLTNDTLSVAALFGLLAVLGIAARNSIMLIAHYQQLEEDGEAFGPELVQRGSRERVAPTLTTALTTGFALLPFVLLGSVPGQEIVYPMAIVILGGLVTSTLLNLFALPALYLRFGASREPDLRLEQAPLPATATD